ncbi:MAG TPA: phosphotransferase [Clostridiales bacterium]|nr:phosphotransferase [Clostridiales bacterium]
MREFITKVPIRKGWSGDEKYRLTDKTGENYLLRVTPRDKSGSRKEMFVLMEQVASLGVPMCHPLEYGECEEGVYTLISWVDGEDAETVIPTLSAEKQYAYGLEAGRILQTIHSIPAPDTQEDWEPRFNRKIDSKIKMYENCPLSYEGGQAFLDYIQENRHLLKNRPQRFQHGDYHIGNMMISTDGQLMIIDFDRFDFGDPWEEFNRIVWCAQSSPLFASGMVNGYFDNAVPVELWHLLALYIASNTLSSLPWAIPFGEEEVKVMQKQARQVLQWYDHMRKIVPGWYAPL